MSLVEILISLVISSIIIAASFASYVVISRNFDFQKEMKNIAQSSRAVVEIIKRDVRLGGFVYDGNTAISEPIKITDGGASASDRIDIIYDQDKNTRLKISYYTVTVKPLTAFERRRLMKTVIQCTVAQCGSGNTVMAPQPIADYVEDLQFTGFKNGNTLGNGAISYGQGNLRQISPVSITHNCTSGSRNTNHMSDSNINTYFECANSHRTTFTFNFDKKFRPITYYISSTAHLDGGSISNTNHPFTTTYPYGKTRTIDFDTRIINKGLATDCAWNSSWTGQINCAGVGDPTVQGFVFVGVSGECTPISNTGVACNGNASMHADAWKRATNKIEIRIENRFKCSYVAIGQPCNPSGSGSDPLQVAHVGFYGEVFGEPQNPQEVEIGLLMRSANEYGSTPIQKTYNIGNRSIVTNDNYIRDTYFTSTLIRNVYYGL